jgi:hypothetical protein
MPTCIQQRDSFCASLSSDFWLHSFHKLFCMVGCFTVYLLFVPSWELLTFNSIKLGRNKGTGALGSRQLTRKQCGFVSNHAHDVWNVMKPSSRDCVSRMFCEESLLVLVFYSFTCRRELCLKHSSYWEQVVKKNIYIPSCSGSRVIAIRPEIKSAFRLSAMLLFHVV